MVFEELFNIEYSFNKPGLKKYKYNKNIVKWNNEKKNMSIIIHHQF